MTRRRRLCLCGRQEESINDPVNFNRASIFEILVKTQVSYFSAGFLFVVFVGKIAEKLPPQNSAPLGYSSRVFAAFVVCFFFRYLTKT